MSQSSRVGLSWLRRIGLAAALCLGLHGAAALAACSADTDCPQTQICSSGVCIAPGQGPACFRDIECGPEQTCQDHHCVQSMPTFPGETPPPPAQAAPAPSAPPAPAAPAPLYGNPPPPAVQSAEQPPAAQAPPTAPPGYAPPPPPPPGYAYPPGYYYPYRRRYVPPPPPPPFHPFLRFDAFAGGALMFLQAQNQAVNVQSWGYGGFSGELELAYHVMPNLAVALRGGTYLGPLDDGTLFSQFYVGAGLMFPWWHWGFVLGATNALDLNSPLGGPVTAGGPRTTGFEIMIPYEYQLAKWLKLTINVSVGIYSDMITQMLHLQLGF